MSLADAFRACLTAGDVPGDRDRQLACLQEVDPELADFLSAILPGGE